MRVALAKGTLMVPPTYFAVQHALAMPDLDWRFVCLAARIDDPAVRLRVLEAVPGADRFPLRLREGAKWPFLRRMEDLLVSERPDLVHQQQATWSLPALRAARRLGVPMLTTLHGADAYAPSLLPAAAGPAERAGRAWTERNRRAAEDSDRVLAVSRALADVALHSGFPATTLHVHYQGVDADWWIPGPPIDEDGAPEVLFVGALSALKGVKELLSAHAAVHEPHRLVLVGDGPLRADVEAIARLDPSIDVLGALPREAVRERMRRACVLVLPTRTTGGRAEAAGLVALEAQACGIPVVVNAVGGAPEMVAPACGDLLASEDRLESLDEALRRVLLMGADERAARGRAAREWVVEERSLARAVRELRAHYADLVGGAATPVAD